MHESHEILAFFSGFVGTTLIVALVGLLYVNKLVDKVLNMKLKYKFLCLDKRNAMFAQLSYCSEGPA